MTYLILFLEGIITFISPCLLPMLPLYLSYFAAGEQDARRTFINALGFVLGFSLVFVALGAFAGTVGSWLREYSTAVNIVTGALVILFGLNYLGVLRIPLLNKTIRTQGSDNLDTQNLGFFSAVAFGVVFSIGWTPCVSAFLGSALLLASQTGSTVRGITMLLTYAFGLALPFLASALLLDQLKGAFDAIKRHYRIVNLISGLLLVVMGILMMTGLMGRLLSLLSI